MICFNRVKYSCIKSCTISFYTSGHRLKEKEKEIKELTQPALIWRGMTVRDLAASMRKDLNYMNRVIKPSLSDCIGEDGHIKSIHRVEKFLRMKGCMYKEISCDVKVQKEEKVVAPKVPVQVRENEVGKVKRPPVVAIMGHVDHGKTTLLDALRSSNIVAGEAGGITQHIGAFSVSVTPDNTITFIDTPGHAAFKKMRSHGAGITDIVVLIVAADDGVMEQTVESIKMAQSTGAKIIVAINKIDKVPEKNMDLIKKQLLEYNIQVDELGGDVQVVGISALKKMNLDQLMEVILLEAEMMNLRSDPDATFEGVVVESFIDKRGKFATVLVKRGTLRKKATLVAGTSLGKVKIMLNENGEAVPEATLSKPVRVGNWDSVPSSGEKVIEVKNEREANLYVKAKRREEKEKKQASEHVVLMKKTEKARADYCEVKKMSKALKDSGNPAAARHLLYFRKKEVISDELRCRVIVKGDTDGSVKALLDILSTYDCDNYCKLDLIAHGVGNITENDIKLAETFDGTIYCFNVEFPHENRELIEEKKIRIKFHNIIYKLLDDLKSEINSKLPQVETEAVKGTGEVLQHFLIKEKKKKVPVAGCVCLTGEFVKSLLFRLERDDEVIHEGELQSLKNFKDSVKLVKKDQHCGVMFKDFEGVFQTGDKITCFERVPTNITITWDPGF